jgi:hypothetical protein
MSAIKVVTGYIPLSTHTRSQNEYHKLGERLLSLPVDIDCYFDTRLEDCWLWQAAHELQELPRVGYSDNARKNTMEYFCIVHQKTEWLERAQKHNPDVDVFVWMDYGIFHLPGITECGILDFLKEIEHSRPTIVEIPGRMPFSESIDTWKPYWRFCGGVLVCPAALVGPFNAAVKKTAIESMTESSRVTWEVNTWALVEKQRLVPIRQYHALAHDQSMLTAYKALDSGGK